MASTFAILIPVLLLVAVPAVPASDPPPLPTLSEPAQAQALAVYAERRHALMDAMKEGVAVIYSEGEEDAFGYRQSGDFFYLTGVEDANAVLVLAPKERTYREILFLESRDPEAERWTGEREPLGGALREKYGFEKIHRNSGSRLLGLMLELTRRSPTLWQVMLPDPAADSRPKDLELYSKIQERLPEVTVKSLGWTLGNMRARHSAEELAIMQHGIRLTEEGFRAAIRLVGPGATEGMVRAEAERVWRAGGSRRTAYPSIVGSGANSTILHYPRSERVMKDGELLLMDMGCEYAHYATDITRTVPVNGRFSAEQRKVYDVVLAAQEKAVAMIKPGVYHEDLEKAARAVIEEAGYGDFFIHGLGHFVGLDVHDAGDYLEPLQAGMVLTMEPGIYLPDRGFGVRIEDEVLVTETGARLLTDDLPRTAEEVERWMATRSP
ncbi:MAG TPA: Xaa-Pro peptidase family protein [Thermoanaerobaculia bacterium]|nr:Xaa-Pro peptidase family protein [Thermoanaerobaculia bacterium]